MGTDCQGNELDHVSAFEYNTDEGGNDMVYTRQLWILSVLSIFCVMTLLYAQIEDVPASQEMIEDELRGEAEESPPAEKSTDAYSGATAMIIEPAVMLYEDLQANGYVVVQGIIFNKDNTLAIESDSCLDVIASMLKDHAKMNIYIVGHTDNAAGVLSGMITSQKRAEAVMNTLANRFEIDLDRLFASGVGPLSPIASNITEEGRLKNNRIELVIQ